MLIEEEKSVLSYLRRYTLLRKASGFKFLAQEGELIKFAKFFEASQHNYICLDVFYDWRESRVFATTHTWVFRYGIVRAFSEWLNVFDCKHDVLPKCPFRGGNGRAVPYILSDQEILSIFEELDKLEDGIRYSSKTWLVYFGLLVVTGMRVSEVNELDDADVNLENKTIFVRNSKNGGQRLIPLLDSTCEVLLEYNQSKCSREKRKTKKFFVGNFGQSPCLATVRRNLSEAMKAVNISSRHPSGRSPRLHDIRHTFAVKNLIKWYKLGRNPDLEMVKLTYVMGHSRLKSTYWYMQAVPELLELAISSQGKSI